MLISKDKECAFKSFADLLPFSHATELSRLAYMGDLSDMLPHLLAVLVYALAALLLAIFAFVRQRKSR